MTESILGCSEVSLVNEINPKLFRLTLWTRAKSNHFLYQNITRTISRSHTKALLL